MTLAEHIEHGALATVILLGSALVAFALSWFLGRNAPQGRFKNPMIREDRDEG